MDLEVIRIRFREGSYEISFHAEKERYAEDISHEDLQNLFDSAEVIEHYPEDPRGESCLILGYSEKRPIHVVCGYSSLDWMRIITVYLPKMPKWVNERTRNRR